MSRSRKPVRRVDVENSDAEVQAAHLQYRISELEAENRSLQRRIDGLVDNSNKILPEFTLQRDVLRYANGQVRCDRYLDPLQREMALFWDHFDFGNLPGRCSNPYEFLCWAVWSKENRARPGVNGGLTTLDHLLKEGDRVTTTQRDAYVAATIMQWFGTNCGAAFLSTLNRTVGEFDAKKEIEIDCPACAGRGHLIAYSCEYNEDGAPCGYDEVIQEKCQFCKGDKKFVLSRKDGSPKVYRTGGEQLTSPEIKEYVNPVAVVKE